MAQITINELLRLVEAHVDWKSGGWSSPRETLAIELSPAEDSSPAQAVIDPEVAGRTITYEGRSVTVVLDFDEHGYLQLIEFA